MKRSKNWWIKPLGPALKLPWNVFRGSSRRSEQNPAVLRTLRCDALREAGGMAHPQPVQPMQWEHRSCRLVLKPLHTYLLVSWLSSQEILSSAVSWPYSFKFSERREEDKGQGRSHKSLRAQRYLLKLPTHVQKHVEAVVFHLWVLWFLTTDWEQITLLTLWQNEFIRVNRWLDSE